MSRSYKFMSSNHIANVLTDGNVMLGSLSKYRLLEQVTGNRWIGDKSEGIVSTLVPQEDIVRGGMEYHRYNNRYVETLSAMVYSYSNGSLPALISAMTESPSPYRYDACLRIKDREALVHAIASAAFEGSLVSENFHILHNRCSYKSHSHEWIVESSRELPKYDPFLKDTIYAEQGERRIVLIPKGGFALTRDQYFFKLDNVDSIFEEVNITTGEVPPFNPFGMSIEDALDALNDIVCDYHSRFSDPLLADLSEQAAWFSSAKQRIGVAYGSLRFDHEISSATVDAMFDVADHATWHFIRQLESFIGEVKFG